MSNEEKNLYGVDVKEDLQKDYFEQIKGLKKYLWESAYGALAALSGASAVIHGSHVYSYKIPFVDKLPPYIQDTIAYLAAKGTRESVILAIFLTGFFSFISLGIRHYRKQGE